MRDLCEDLSDLDPIYGEFHVWHLHEAVWLWQHQYAVIQLSRRVQLGLLFDLDGLTLDAGWPRADPGQVDRYRAAVASTETGRELAKIVDGLREAGFVICGDEMKRPPRNWPVDHPRLQLARAGYRPWARGDDVSTFPDLVRQRVRSVYGVLDRRVITPPRHRIGVDNDLRHRWHGSSVPPGVGPELSAAGGRLGCDQSTGRTDHLL